MGVSERDDAILQHILDIKIEMASISENVRNMDLRIVDNAKKIEKNRENNVETKLTMSKWAGSIAILGIVANVAAYYFFK